MAEVAGHRRGSYAYEGRRTPGYLRAMLKLLIVAGILATVYFWYRGQRLLTERRDAELDRDAQLRRQPPIDVDAEIIESQSKARKQR